jgi:hypothetical protein
MNAITALDQAGMNALDRIHQRRLFLARRKGREHGDEHYGLPGCHFRCRYRGWLAAKQADQIVKTRLRDTMQARLERLDDRRNHARPAAASSDRDIIDLDASDIRFWLTSQRVPMAGCTPSFFT